MWHELLRKPISVKVVNGRRYAHTPEFRKEERGYKRYEDANVFLAELLK